MASIGDMAFAYCKGMSTLTLPETILSIGDGVLKACRDRLKVYYGGTHVEWEKILIGKENTELCNVTLICKRDEVE